MPIIGIDLGTTNSLVSCYINDQCILIPNALGERMTPSVVSIDEENHVIVGKAAKERLISHPHLTASAFKRNMGTSKLCTLGSFSLTAVDLSAYILKSLKSDAETFLQMEIKEAIISVPAYFNDKQRSATKAAAELAGLKVERLINEPTAAAIAYGLHLGNEEQKFLVFDLGGGTFDVSILDIYDDIMEVKAVAGNNHLGGEDFDECLRNAFLNHLGIKEESLDHKTLSNLKKQAEKCKISLSTESEATMFIMIYNKSYIFRVTASLFQELTIDLVSKLRQPLHKALKDSNLSIDELNHIILVGGSSRMPIVQSLVSNMFGRTPMDDINPDEVVALGAGIAAGMKERNEHLQEIIMTDVCPFSLGTSVIYRYENHGNNSGQFYPIIERNTLIPCSKQQTFSTTYDNQESVIIDVYQGESLHNENNLYLGEIPIAVKPAPKGVSNVDVRFTYDINGILDIDVYSASTGEKKNKVILNHHSDMSDDEISAHLKKLEVLKIHPREDSKNKYLIAKAERLYEESLSDTRKLIVNELNHFMYILNEQDPQEIEMHCQKFQLFLDFVENEENNS